MHSCNIQQVRKTLVWASVGRKFCPQQQGGLLSIAMYWVLLGLRLRDIWNGGGGERDSCFGGFDVFCCYQLKKSFIKVTPKLNANVLLTIVFTSNWVIKPYC